MSSLYREAVMERSPGLPRFAATLVGIGQRKATLSGLRPLSHRVLSETESTLSGLGENMNLSYPG